MDKFPRMGKFVRDHAFGIGVGIGLVASLTVIKITGVKDPGVIHRLSVSSEQLQHLIDNTEGVISFDVSSKEKIWIINSATKEVFP